MARMSTLEICHLADHRWAVIIDGGHRATVSSLDEALAIAGTPVFEPGETPGSWTVRIAGQPRPVPPPAPAP
jgi:hypothetical protein